MIYSYYPFRGRNNHPNSRAFFVAARVNSSQVGSWECVRCETRSQSPFYKTFVAVQPIQNGAREDRHFQFLKTLETRMVAEPLVEKAYALGSRMAFACSFVPLYALSTKDRVPGAKLVEIIWEV